MLFAAKMAMAGLPNIEPVSLLVMLYAVCFGWRGLCAVYVYVLLEFAVWGVGLWSVCYLYVWPLLFGLARLLLSCRCHGDPAGTQRSGSSGERRKEWSGRSPRRQVPEGLPPGTKQSGISFDAAALSGCFGLLFGALCAPVWWITGGWAAAVSWWLSGLPFDLLHGVGNFVIALVLFKPLRRWLDRLSKQYHFTE